MEAVLWFEYLWTVVCSVLFYSLGSEPNHRKEQAPIAGERAFQTSLRAGV